MKIRAFTTAFCLTMLVVGMGNLAQSSASAEDNRDDKSCEVAIARAKERISQGRDIRIVSSESADSTPRYPDHPNGRPLIFTILLDGNAARSVMNSPVFQKTIASEIIRACSSVGAVSFGKYQTGWGSTVGLMADGTIESFQCAEMGRDRPNPSWGQEYCDL
jgi:hypothetical protein